MINLTSRIRYLLSNIHPDVNTTLSAKQSLNEIVNKLCLYLIKNLHDSNELHMLLPPEIYKYAIKECTEDLKYYGKKALAIDSDCVKKVLTHYELTTNVSTEFLACIVEYLMCEVLEVSGVLTRSKRKAMITAEYIDEAIEKDE